MQPLWSFSAPYGQPMSPPMSPRHMPSQPQAPPGYHWELVKDPGMASAPPTCTIPLVPFASPTLTTRCVPSNICTSPPCLSPARLRPTMLPFASPAALPTAVTSVAWPATSRACSPTLTTRMLPSVVSGHEQPRQSDQQFSASTMPATSQPSSVPKVEHSSDSVSLEAERQINRQLRQQVADMKEQIEELRRQLEKERQSRTLVAIEEIDFPLKLYRGDQVLREKVRVIERRGNILVDGNTGRVDLLKPIMFVKRSTNDEPTAEFEQPDVAKLICRDLGELSSHFHDPIHIEGHTRGGTTKFWQELAGDRARIVAELMVEFGADPANIRTFGRPGTLGLNETRTVVYFDIPEITSSAELARLEALEEQQPRDLHWSTFNPFHYKPLHKSSGSKTHNLKSDARLKHSMGQMKADHHDAKVKSSRIV